MRHPLVFAGALAGFLGVALGAFGAHALAPTLAAAGMTEVWHTAVLYHLIHAVAVLWAGGAGLRKARIAGWCWMIGIILFSGSLYAMALTGWRPLGYVTPLGGLALLAGWAVAAIGAVRGDSTI